MLKLVLFLKEICLKKFLVPWLFLWLCPKISSTDYMVMVPLAKINF